MIIMNDNQLIIMMMMTMTMMILRMLQRRNHYLELLKCPPHGTDIHIVRAAESDRWSPEIIRSIDDAVEVAKVRLK